VQGRVSSGSENAAPTTLSAFAFCLTYFYKIIPAFNVKHLLLNKFSLVGFEYNGGHLRAKQDTSLASPVFHKQKFTNSLFIYFYFFFLVFLRDYKVQ